MSGKFYRLTASPLFEVDLNEVVSYITNRLGDPAAAIHFVDVITEAVFERLAAPERYEPYHTTRQRPYPYYFIKAGGYTIYYVVIGNAMELRRLRYNGQAPKDPTRGSDVN